MKKPLITINPAQPPPASSVGSVIGPDLVFDGKVSGEGDLTILGRVSGTVAVGQVTVRELARVDGALRGAQIDVRGRVEGEIRGQTIRIFNGAEVEASLTYETLYIEVGSSVNGDVRQVTSSPAASANGQETKAIS